MSCRAGMASVRSCRASADSKQIVAFWGTLCHFQEVKVGELGIGFPVESAADLLERSSVAQAVQPVMAEPGVQCLCVRER